MNNGMGTVTKEEFKRISVMLENSRTGCGTPPDLMTTMNFSVQEGERVINRIVKYCEDCSRLSKTTRECVRCTKDFMPTCNSRYTCQSCKLANHNGIIRQ